MSDSTSLLEQVATAQSQKEVTVNALFDAASVGAAYGRHAETCAGLTWGYYGTRWGGTAVANGTNACTANTTTYMVANLTTGAVSFATATTNWNDATTYGRCFKIVTGASTVTSYEDHRFGPSGVHSASGTSSILPIDLTSDVTGVLPVANFATGTPSGSKFVRDDGVLASIALSTDVTGSLPAGQASAVAISVYTATGSHTWSKPTGAKMVQVICIGAGASGTPGGIRSGGGGAYAAPGGAGGSRVEALFDAATLSATEDLSVGTGGATAAGMTSVDTAPGLGNSGGNTTFGTTTPKVTAYGGGTGYSGLNVSSYGGGGAGALSAGGNATSSANGAAGSLGGIAGVTVGTQDNAGVVGGAGGNTGAVNAAGSAAGSAIYGGSAGGPGGNVTSSSAVTAAIAGGSGFTSLAGGTAGTSGASPTVGGNGSAPTRLGRCGTGGGGGGSSVTASQNGRAGGTGGIGCGGGGGGHCYSSGTTTGGAGGAGGNGSVTVITFF